MKGEVDKILEILEGAKDEAGCVPMALVRQALKKLEQRWIPCSERLPIGSDIVLLSLPPSIDMNGEELVEGVICGHYISGKNEMWGISDGCTFGYGLVSTRYGTNPTHWMPLPEPAKEL